MENVDALLVNADWTKQTWDLPPYKSDAFFLVIGGKDRLRNFRKLPVYQFAVEKGLIVKDKWVGDKLEKRAKPKGRALSPLNHDRTSQQVLARRATRVMVKFLNDAKKRIVPKVVAAAENAFKAATTDVLDTVDLSVFKTLPSKLKPLMQQAAQDGGSTVLRTIKVGVAATGDPDLRMDDSAFDQVNDYAVEYAETRSAELVGMKYVDGELVPNSNAEWAIDEGTREGIRAAVEDVQRGDLPVTELADRLSADYSFSPQRAEMIARTEMRMADGAGALAGYKASGVVQRKVWLTSQDDDVSEDCEDNAAAGPIPLDDDFPSGDDAEPAHPNCRCAIAPWIDWDTEGEEA